jgi:hypothetical protein
MVLAHPTHHLEYGNKIMDWKMSNYKKEFGVEARKVTEKFSITIVVWHFINL